MLLVFESMQVLTASEIDSLLDDCDKLSRMITNYSNEMKIRDRADALRLPLTASRLPLYV